LYQLNTYILNRPYVVICWIGGVGPHHENEFDVVLSVTGDAWYQRAWFCCLDGIWLDV